MRHACTNRKTRTAPPITPPGRSDSGSVAARTVPKLAESILVGAKVRWATRRRNVISDEVTSGNPAGSGAILPSEAGDLECFGGSGSTSEDDLVACSSARSKFSAINLSCTGIALRLDDHVHKAATAVIGSACSSSFSSQLIVSSGQRSQVVQLTPASRATISIWSKATPASRSARR